MVLTMVFSPHLGITQIPSVLTPDVQRAWPFRSNSLHVKINPCLFPPERLFAKIPRKLEGSQVDTNDRWQLVCVCVSTRHR